MTVSDVSNVYPNEESAVTIGAQQEPKSVRSSPLVGLFDLAADSYVGFMGNCVTAVTNIWNQSNRIFVDAYQGSEDQSLVSRYGKAVFDATGVVAKETVHAGLKNTALVIQTSQKVYQISDKGMDGALSRGVEKVGGTVKKALGNHHSFIEAFTPSIINRLLTTAGLPPAYAGALAVSFKNNFLIPYIKEKLPEVEKQQDHPILETVLGSSASVVLSSILGINDDNILQTAKNETGFQVYSQLVPKDMQQWIFAMHLISQGVDIRIAFLAGTMINNPKTAALVLKNFLSSVGTFVMHPIDTIKNIPENLIQEIKHIYRTLSTGNWKEFFARVLALLVPVLIAASLFAFPLFPITTVIGITIVVSALLLTATFTKMCNSKWSLSTEYDKYLASFQMSPSGVAGQVKSFKEFKEEMAFDNLNNNNGDEANDFFAIVKPFYNTLLKGRDFNEDMQQAKEYLDLSASSERPVESAAAAEEEDVWYDAEEIINV